MHAFYCNIRLLLLHHIHIIDNQIKLRVIVASKRLQHTRTSAAFIRIMTTIENDIERENALLTNFLYDTMPAVKAYTHTKQDPLH